MATNDVSERLERLEAFEERAEVRLQALAAYQYKDGGAVRVGGELHPRSGEQLKRRVQLVVAVYDENGAVVGQGTTGIPSERFYGFHPFSVNIDILPSTKITKIRVFPK